MKPAEVREAAPSAKVVFVRCAIILGSFAGILTAYDQLAARAERLGVTLGAQFEQQVVPFDPDWVWVYIAYYPYLLVTFLRAASKPGFWRAYGLSLSVVSISFCVFWAAPTCIDRPPFAPNSPSASVLGWLWRIDASGNCAPSLHASLMTWAVHIGIGRCGQPRWFAAPCWILVLYSTLAVRQHVVVDLITGVALALGAVGVDRLAARSDGVASSGWIARLGSVQEQLLLALRRVAVRATFLGR